MKLIGEATDPPCRPDRLSIKVLPEVRERLATLLTMYPEMRAVGYSEFINRACQVVEEEIAAEREQAQQDAIWSLTEAERRVLEHGPTPGCPSCDDALESLRDKILGG